MIITVVRSRNRSNVVTLVLHIENDGVQHDAHIGDTTSNDARGKLGLFEASNIGDGKLWRESVEIPEEVKFSRALDLHVDPVQVIADGIAERVEKINAVLDARVSHESATAEVGAQRALTVATRKIRIVESQSGGERT